MNETPPAITSFPANAPPALLSYSIAPDVVPYTGNESAPSVVDLQIAIANATGHDLDVAQIVFTVSSGAGGGDLTADPSAIIAAAALGTPWSISSDGGGSFTCVPQAPATGLSAGSSIAFTLSWIQVNELPGLVEIVVHEQTRDLRMARIGVSKVPPGLAITSFQANPIQLVPGDPTTISWTSIGADAATLSFAGTSLPVPRNGTHRVTPLETTTYTLEVEGGGRTIAQQLTVTVTPLKVEIRSFRVDTNPVDLQHGPQVVTLTWDVANAVYVDLDGVGKVTGTSARVQVSATQTFVLRALGRDPHDLQTAALTVQSLVDFLATHTFSLRDHEHEPGHDFDEVLMYDATLVETLSFSEDGGGQYSYSIDGRARTPSGSYPINDSWSSPTAWTLRDRVLSLTTGRGPIAVAVSGTTLVYRQSLDIDFTRKQDTFNASANVGARRRALATGAPPAIFLYAVTPADVPYAASETAPSVVALQISVNNPTDQDVDVAQIVFTIPSGARSGDLTDEPSAIAAAAALGTPWSISPDGAGSFTCVPEAPATGLAAGGSIAFTLSWIQVNQLAGLVEIAVYEQTDATRTAWLGVSKVPPGLAITSFQASPIQVEPGAPTTLAWTSTGADAATLSFGGASRPVATSGTYVAAPQETTTYTLAIEGGGQTTAQQLTVTVPRVRILSFSAQPVEVAQGGSSTLSWRTVNASSVFVEPGHIPVDPSGGTLVVHPGATTEYVLVANGPGGADSRPAVVDVMPVAITSLAVSPAPAVESGFLTVTWTTAWATRVTLFDPASMHSPVPVPPSGSRILQAFSSETITLAAEGLGGPVTRQLAVTVTPWPLALNFGEVPQVAPGLLQWFVIGEATISPGIGPVQGFGGRHVAPGTYTMATIGSPTPIATALIPGGPPSVRSFTVVPAALPAPGDVVMSWNVISPFVTCAITAPDGTVTSGIVNGIASQALALAEAGTYTIKLYGQAPSGGGTLLAQAAVQVGRALAAREPAAVLSYAVTPDVVPYSAREDAPSDVTLMIAVNNGTGVDQEVAQIVFAIPVGADTGDLTREPSRIAAAPALGTTWSISSDGAGSFTAVPRPPAHGLRAGGSIAFLLSGVRVNELAGLAEIEVYEQTGATGQTLLGVSKVPPGLAITSFFANPIQVSPGTPATLSWTTTGATSATLSGAGRSDPVPPDGQAPVSPQQTTTYTLTASGGGRSISQQLTITVSRVHILSFGASPTQVPQGGPSTLTWQIADGAAAWVEPGHVPVDADRGTLPVHPQESTTYVLEASGPGGWDSRPFAVDVLPVSIECFQLLDRPPGVFTAPNKLAWTTRNATSASIAPGFPHVPVSGTQPIAPASPTTYVLRAEGGGGPALAQVSYAPPPAWYRSGARMPGGLYATPSGVQLGDAAYFVTGIGEGGGPAKSYRSTDGVTWTATPIDPALARLGSVLLAFDGALWILGGNASLSLRLQNDVWRSTDGVTWRQVTASAAWAPRAWHAGTVFDGKMWIASGLTDGGSANDVWSSSDGARWTCTVQHAPWEPRSGASLVATEDRMFLLGGTNGFDGPQGYLDDVWLRGPSSGWDRLGRPGWTGRWSAFAAALGGEVYFGAGQDYSSNLADLWILNPSSYAWTRFPGPTPGLFTFDSNLLAFRGNLFVCGGFGDDTIHYFVPKAG